MQQIFIQIVIRLLGLLEYYNFIAVAIINFLKKSQLTGDQSQKKHHKLFYIFLLAKILHYTICGVNNKMQLTAQ